MTPNVFSVDLFVSKGADGSLLLDIHPDDNGWYNPESKPALPVLPLSRERVSPAHARGELHRPGGEP